MLRSPWRRSRAAATSALLGAALAGCPHDAGNERTTDDSLPRTTAPSSSRAEVGGDPTSSAATDSPPAPPTSGSAVAPSAGGAGDEFDGSALAPTWARFSPEATQIALQGGSLHLTPKSNTLWFHGDRGPFFHQTVRGDFAFTSSVRSRKAASPDRPVDSGYQFGGVLARDPRSDQPGAKENHVFVVVGYRGDTPSVETKTTEGGHSQVEGPAWPSTDAEIRICRVGATFHMLKRPVGGGAWQKAATYSRPDLPAELQVGLIAYAYTHAADVRASFEYARFTKVARESDCSS